MYSVGSQWLQKANEQRSGEKPRATEIPTDGIRLAVTTGTTAWHSTLIVANNLAL